MSEQQATRYQIDGVEFQVREGFEKLIEAMINDASVAWSAIECLTIGDTYTPQEAALIIHLMRESNT